jgi:plastocyanin
VPLGLAPVSSFGAIDSLCTANVSTAARVSGTLSPEDTAGDTRTSLSVRTSMADTTRGKDRGPVMAARHFTTVIGATLTLLLVAQPHAGRGPGLSGMVRVNGQPERNVVVWLVGVKGLEPAPAKVVLDQRNLAFAPQVVAVRVGTPVDMPNNDRVFHNVFSFKDGKKFDLGLYPVGQSKVVTFDKAGVSRIFCNIHPNMAAYVVAVDSPFFGVSDRAGSFTMAAVPSGTYTYHAWRPGHEPATGQLTVQPDALLEVRLP